MANNTYRDQQDVCDEIRSKNNSFRCSASWTVGISLIWIGYPVSGSDRGGAKGSVTFQNISPMDGMEITYPLFSQLSINEIPIAIFGESKAQEMCVNSFP